MGTVSEVRDFRGGILRQGVIEMSELLAAARQARLPFLGCVDEYDNTVFNQLQAAVVREELARIESFPGLESAVAEVRSMIDEVQQRPHRYLVFNGD